MTNLQQQQYYWQEQRRRQALNYRYMMNMLHAAGGGKNTTPAPEPTPTMFMLDTSGGNLKTAMVYHVTPADESLPITIDWGDGTVDTYGGQQSSLRSALLAATYQSNEVQRATHTYPWATAAITQTVKVTNAKSIGLFTDEPNTRGSDYAPVTDVQFGNTVTEIEAFSFVGCSSLTSMTIPTTIESIGMGAFSGCSQQLTLEFPGRNNIDLAGMDNYGNWGITESQCQPETHIVETQTIVRTIYGFSYGYNITGKFTASSIPENIAQYVESITLGSGVVDIDEDAFKKYWNLTSVTFGDYLTNIGEKAFYSCSNLESVDIQNTGRLKNIKQLAFCNCGKLASITIPDGVKTIGSYAFYDCDSLESMTVPNSVTSIGQYAFMGCSNVKLLFAGRTQEEVDAMENKYWGLTADKCIAEKSIPASLATTVVYADGSQKLFAINGALSKSQIDNVSQARKIQVGELVTSIADSAFLGCNNLTSVTMPSDLTSIGDSAFYRTGIIDIELPAKVSGVGDHAFYSCSNLTGVAIPDTVGYIDDHAFSECSNLVSVNIPSGLKRLGVYVFSFCGKLTDLSIPAGLTDIGQSAFYNCSSLSNVYFAGKTLAEVQTMASYPFERYPAGTPLTAQTAFKAELPANIDLTLDDGSDVQFQIYNRTYLKRDDLIGLEAGFTSYLESITLDNGINDMEDGIFLDFDGLTEIKLNNQVFTKNVVTEGIKKWKIGINSAGQTHNVKVWCADGSIVTVGSDDDSSEEEPWDEQKTRVTYASGETKILDISGVLRRSQIENVSDIRKIEIGNQVTAIEDHAFNYCNQLKSVFIPSSVTDIDRGAFINCGQLTNITIDSVVTNIGDAAFYNCSNLTGIAIGDTGIDESSAPDITIGYRAFYNCTRLAEVSLGQNVTSIGGEAFSCCQNLKIIHCYSVYAPSISSDTFGDSTYSFTGRNTYNANTNVLHTVSRGLSVYGYDTGYWADPLQNKNKCGFTFRFY